MCMALEIWKENSGMDWKEFTALPPEKAIFEIGNGTRGHTNYSELVELKPTIATG